MREVMSANNYTNVLVEKPNTTLCDLAEPRLKDALAIGGIICVNGLVVKTNGLVAAVAPRSMEVNGGILEPGAFYQIYDRSKGARPEERRILDAFLEGETEITLPGTTEWFRARPVRLPAERLEEAVDRAVTLLREEGRPFLPDRESRNEFLQQARQEEFPEA